MRRAGHMEGMKEKNCQRAKRVDAKKQGGCRKIRRPQLRWENYLNRDHRMAEEKQKWRETASDGKICKKITAAAAPLFNKWLVLPIEQGNKE